MEIQVKKLEDKIDRADNEFTEAYQCLDAIKFDMGKMKDIIQRINGKSI